MAKRTNRSELPIDQPPALDTDAPGGPHEVGTGAALNPDAVKEAKTPATGEAGAITMIDALHVPGKPARFKPGARVRANVISRDPKTNQPEVVIHRATELPADCAVTVDSYIDEDLAKYRCTLARDDAAPESK